MNQMFDVLNPATGAVVGQAPDGGAVEAKAAVAAAAGALPAWKALSVNERAKLLHRWADVIASHTDELAALLTAEQGKPLAEARAEVDGGVAGIRWSAEAARQVYGETFPTYAPGNQYLTLKQPVGVVAAITPWNFPVAMITRKVAPALGVGCTVVLKPAEDTPLTALFLEKSAQEAGLPVGVFTVVSTAQPQAVGQVWMESPVVRKLSFTGSSPVGKLLMAQAAQTVKKLTLELGGNCPLIVFEDADLDAAVAGALALKFRNAGQTCNNINRLYVHRQVYEAFVEKLVAGTGRLQVGDGAEAGTQVGPVINEKAIQKIERLVTDAVEKGAKVALGGARHSAGNCFYQPTVLTEMTHEMAAAQEEIFGPVAAVYPFETEEEVLTLANATPYGLTAYFYSENVRRCWRVAATLEAGMVAVNSTSISRAELPFGGIKESGIGRLGAGYGVEEYLDVKAVGFSGIAQG